MGKLVRPIGDLDLHLFGEGTHRRLWELLGPQPLHVGDAGRIVGARFALWAPDATSVAVVGDWNGWEGDPMAPVGVSGIWAAAMPLARTGHRYGFDVTHDGNDLERVGDPVARENDTSPGGFSVVPTSDGHAWNDAEWLRVRGAAIDSPRRIRHVDLAVLHDQGARSWDEVAARLLDEVVERGDTHLELSPVMQAPPTDSSACWASRYATDAQFGDPDGFRRLVDAFHQRDVGVVLVWPLTRRECSSGDLRRREVRNLLIANALYWLDEFHVDGVRLGIDRTEQLPELAGLIGHTVAVVSEEFPDALIVVD